jgi:hypothetical protein
MKLKEIAKPYFLVLISFLSVSWVATNCSNYFTGQSVVRMSKKHGSLFDISKDATLYICYNPDELIGRNISFISPFKYKKRIFEKEIPLRNISSVFTSSDNEKIKLTKINSLIMSYESSSYPGMFFVQNSKNYKLATEQKNNNLPFIEPNKPQMEGDLRLMTTGGLMYYFGLVCCTTIGLCVIAPDYYRSVRNSNL